MIDTTFHYYEYSCSTKFHIGPDSISHIHAWLCAAEAEKPLIVTDPNVRHSGIPALVTEHFKGTKYENPITFDEIPMEPDVHTAEALARSFKSEGCDLLLAIGGRGVIDAAKAANILISTGCERLQDSAGTGNIAGPLIPLGVVPTTTGGGTEITSLAIVTEPVQKRKLIFSSEFLLPRAVFLDPQATRGLSPLFTAATVLDALTHAIEAYTSLERNPLSDAQAAAAIQLIFQHLTHLIENPHDIDILVRITEAASLAGAAFSNAMVGLLHSLGHSLESIAGVHHGIATGLLLPAVLRFNLSRSSRRIGELLYYMKGAAVYRNTALYSRPWKVLGAITELRQQLQDATGGSLPLVLSDIRDDTGTQKVTPAMLPRIARMAMEHGLLVYNPRHVTYEEALTILESVW